MRKIEQEMNRAILLGRNWASGNTAVVFNQSGSADVYLHGNHIANCCGVAPRQIHVTVNRNTLSRWPTPTTKSRLRALGVDVYTKNHTLYLHGEAL